MVHRERIVVAKCKRRGGTLRPSTLDTGKAELVPRTFSSRANPPLPRRCGVTLEGVFEPTSDAFQRNARACEFCVEGRNKRLQYEDSPCVVHEYRLLANKRT